MQSNKLGAAGEEVAKHVSYVIVPRPPYGIVFVRYQEGGEGHAAFHIRRRRTKDVFKGEKPRR